MNKSEFIAAVAAKTGLTKSATEQTIDAFAEVTKEAVAQGDDVRLAGVFNLTVEHKPARTGRNPTTGASIAIAAKNAVKIKPSKALSDAANAL